ncbi:DUF4336 domain-containing protein [Maricaulis parjimensis]|uniref:DUF4336 domain-containing protein n=1 Tax=Maricaulis parjimensis TaxID=144023 RepID=UPI0019393467|nr:DUF4336 domain-containing protein [Maricaulis parjimensis]
MDQTGLVLMDGPTVTGLGGFVFPTRMVVIRLANDRLWVWSPIALDAATKQAVDALGLVSDIIAPNSLHDLALTDWHAAYPSARLHAAPGLAKKRLDLDFATTLSDASDPAWAGEIDQVVVPGNAITTEVVFFHRASGTVIVTDLLQEFPPDWFTGWRRWIARWDGMTRHTLSVPNKFRLAFTDKPAARPAMARIREWPCEQLVVAHGPVVHEDAQAVLDQAFAWLG